MRSPSPPAMRNVRNQSLKGRLSVFLKSASSNFLLTNILKGPFSLYWLLLTKLANFIENLFFKFELFIWMRWNLLGFLYLLTTSQRKKFQYCITFANRILNKRWYTVFNSLEDFGTYFVGSFTGCLSLVFSIIMKFRNFSEKETDIWSDISMRFKRYKTFLDEKRD